MLLLLHPRRLTDPVDRASDDSFLFADAGGVHPTAVDQVTWYSLQHANKVPKRATLLSSITAPVPGEDRRHGRLKGR